MRSPLVLLSLIALTGCSIAQPAVKVDYYQMDYEAPKREDAPLLDVVLGIRRFGIAAAYDHDRLVQKDKDLKMTQSYYHRWLSNPRMMLSDQLLRDLLASGSYKAVAMMPANIAPDYEISGFILEIAKDNSVAQPRVFIGAEITLLRGSVQRVQSDVIFQKSYQSEVAITDSSPKGIAKAMSTVWQDISLKIQNDVYERIKSTLATPTPIVPSASPAQTQ